MTANASNTSNTSIDAWIDAVVARHSSELTSQEFTRAVRALSMRYVERRANLPQQSPLDSAGKRAAFAGFYAPLHFLTVREVVFALRADQHSLHTIIDLGCGTGVAGAAWAHTLPSSPVVHGVDASGWAIAEARWNWKSLNVGGRVRRGDLIDAVSRIPTKSVRDTGIIAAWSVNELTPPETARLLPMLRALANRGAIVLIVEPLARAATPWWDEWCAAVQADGGRADEWKFAHGLTPALATIDHSAGFHRRELSARTVLWAARVNG